MCVVCVFRTRTHVVHSFDYYEIVSYASRTAVGVRNAIDRTE